MGAANLPDRADEDRGVILLADDEDALRRAIARKLRGDGHAVVEATSGRHALELLEEHDVDVLLSDISMPDLDGVELLREARQRKPDVPVLLMTALPAIGTAMKAVQYGASDYLTKPLDLEKLAASLTRAIRMHRDLVEQRRVLDSAVRAKAAPVSHPIEPSTLVAGSVLDHRYRIVRPLGSGGMGAVYEAAREDLGSMQVAVKVLHPTLASRADSVLRFRREAEVVAALRHPNIVHILDFVSSDDGNTFLVMELLNGRTLASAIDGDPPFSDARVAFIASQILSALEAAHGMGVVHRDLKPENVFLTTISGLEDVVKVLDFGIAKLTSKPHEAKLTQTGTVLGTPAYMAPEYARGEPADVFADVYAVGCVMYEMLTKKQPFTAQNYHALLYAIQQTDPEPIAEIRPDASPDLAALISKAMAKEPEDRFSSAHAMADALEPWMKRDSGHRPESTPTIGTAPTELSVLKSKKKKSRPRP